MSSTKNTKDNRKVVIATYCDVFKIPNDLDLEDKEVVEDWWVEYGNLHIKYVGKEEVEEINPFGSLHQKWPKSVNIEDADDEYQEEDEEEED